MKKVLIGFLAIALVMSFSMAYADPLVYTNVRPVAIGATSDLPSACPGYANCELATLLGMTSATVLSNQNTAGYWQLGGINHVTDPVVSFEVTANSNTFRSGIFSVNGSDTSSSKNLVDIFLGPAAAGTAALIQFTGGSMTITAGAGSPANSINVGTFTGINPSAFGFYEKPGNPSDPNLTYYSLDQLNGGLAQVLAFRDVSANRWTIAFEDTAYSLGDHDYNDFIFQIESITPVPEPATLLLLGLGLVSLAGIRRKFKS